ncbi:hypothetical protein Xcel_0974 [Xylanimonas cellulosilytica DSM 15894]|uniref:Heavy metal transporter n=1 Tax=Xylanimonas cellulosilytica (strain DSM 15894 / JCM 12276 / CECT 5975 / KCTC 9989 / LMG 20990 / NBRC 107835 / XIL07) TaxID=446471 RepID=D1BYT0_XYLCX|nr:hypothetical protein [Xylanimonas cellulosilytica]ACZ30005.1 hypothetical protein Xcel_0974 [Xylanimonas cellulosilytica DSM 15894]
MSARRRRRRRGLVAVVTAVAVAGAGAGAWWVVTRDDATPARERCSAALDGTDWYLTPVQAEHAALVAGATVRRGMPARAATIGLATALQESRLVNIDYGDRDSLGLFQQRPSQGWGTIEQIMDPLYATDTFFDALATVPGYESLEVTVAAQTVQRSAFPDAYAQHEVRSRAWASGLTGHSPAVISCELAPAGAPRPAADVVAALTERAARDLGLSADAVVVTDPDGDDGGAGTGGSTGAGLTVQVDAAALPTEDPARAAWVVAQWAVATASVTDVVEVAVADRAWSRASGVRAGRTDDDAWQAGAGTALAPGTVALRLATG